MDTENLNRLYNFSITTKILKTILINKLNLILGKENINYPMIRRMHGSLYKPNHFLPRRRNPFYFGGFNSIVIDDFSPYLAQIVVENIDLIEKAAYNKATGDYALGQLNIAPLMLVKIMLLDILNSILSH